jgi:hypothetical protein
MLHAATVPQSSRCVRILFSVFGAAAILLGMPGPSHADAISEARNEIRQYKADISKAKSEISNREGRIFAGDLLIATAEVALEEAKKKPDNTAEVIALQISLGALRAKKNDLVKEKQEWERYKRECERSLAEWEAYLRKLGG